MRNKKAVAPLVFIGVALTIIIIIYLILFIPIPAFTKLRQTINYYLVVSLWFLIQALVVYGAYKIIDLLIQANRIYKDKILRADIKIKNFLLRH